MALALDIVKGGFSGHQAKAIGGQVNSAVTAAGTALATATDLTASVNIVTTATTGQGVQVPLAEIGDEVEILNTSGAPIVVYPESASAKFNDLTAGAGFTLADNTSVKCKKYTSTVWGAFLSA